MITKTHDTAQSLCLVTFTFQASAKVHHVSVCGDFNSWTAGAHPLQPLGGGKFSATIPLPAGRRFAFKYLCDHGGWHNDEAADEYAPNEYGVVNSVVSTVAPATKTKTAAKAPAKKAAANKAVAKTPSKEPPAKKAPAKKKAAAKKSTGSSD